MSHTFVMRARRIPLLAYVLVVLALVLLLSLASFRFSGAFAGSGGGDPNGGVTNGSMINPDGLAAGCGMDGNGGCLSHASHLLATGPTIDNNG